MARSPSRIAVRNRLLASGLITAAGEIAGSEHQHLLDGDLIRVCMQHAANFHNYNNHEEEGEDEEHDRLWALYEESRDAVSAAVPQTLAGIVAKVRAAKVEAQPVDPDGEESWEGCPASAWATDVCNDLLRIFGEG